jgi:hypothetical protein
MPPPKTIRLTINSEGIRRRLLTIQTTSDGSLLLMTATKQRGARDLGLSWRNDGSEKHNAPIMGDKYTVHPSPKIETENALHWKRRLAGHSEERIPQFTRAIKRRDRFAHLFSRRSQSHRMPDTAIAKPTGMSIHLGDYNSSRATLVYSVFIAHAGLRFERTVRDFNIRQFVVGEYRVLVLYSFLPIDAGPSQLDFPTMTFDPALAQTPEQRALFDRLMNGYTSRQVLEVARVQREKLRDEYLVTYPQEQGGFNQVVKANMAIARCGFLLNGMVPDSEFHRLIDNGFRVGCLTEELMRELMPLVASGRAR